MNIGVAYEDGQIAKNLGGCRTFLVVTTEGQNPTGKHLAQAEGDSTTALLKLASMEKLDVLICGALGLAIRNALEMILAIYKSQKTSLPVELPLENFASSDMKGEF